MTDPNFEGLFDRLRRQTTMSPAQSSMLQQQPPQPVPQVYPGSGMASGNNPRSPAPPYSAHSESPVYSMRQNSAPAFASAPDASYPQQSLDHHHPVAHQSPLPTPSQQNLPYNLPMSPPVGTPIENRTASLLQLLKFQQPVQNTGSPAPESFSDNHHQPPPDPAARPPVHPPQSGISQPTQSPPPHSRAASANDLVATLFNQHGSGSPNGAKENTPPARSPIQQRSFSENTIPQRESTPVNPQDLVFKLLGRTKPQQEGPPQNPRESHDAPQQTPTPQGSSIPPPPAISSPVGTPPGQSSTAAPEAPSSGSPALNKGLFTYVNPFEQLQATSPRNRTPMSSTPGPQGRKSALSNEIRAENIPLPFTPPPAYSANTPSGTPPATIEAEAAKEATTLDQVKEKERLLMEQLGLHMAGYPFSGIGSSAEEATRQEPDTASPSEAFADAPEEKPEPVPQQEEVISEEPVGIQDEPPAEPQEPQPAEEEPGQEESGDDGVEGHVQVYNFPMKPFSSITIVPSAIKRVNYPVSKHGDIAKMTRPFDQLNRNLIAASHRYIAYSVSKSNNRGGIRIIRQYDGKDRVIMKDSPDKTFNVVIAKGDRVLGTGVSGAVVWVDLHRDFESDGWSSLFVFPPSEEQGQSNGVLKSRARKTSRLDNVFAVGRGKTISIIHAPTAKHYASGRKGNEVDSKKYVSDHSRIIDTGKASKDFAFSDDDTVIISIDKAGKLKFWDVQNLLDFSKNPAYDIVRQEFPPQAPMSLSTPMLIFSAVAAGESYRATSVMFLDKYRPYHKCMALRYVIVGMKQNHTLQLWDLALGRPVQEINFPQESDTDALCSVVYHPMSGIIVVGNPTRNSIYFIHLSAPKYNLPAMSQAAYIQALATKNPAIPKPDATAILSGLREYSLAAKGQLMSLDILDTEGDGLEDKSPLFELYIAHSKGMTSINVYKDDLGWDADNRPYNPVDAVQAGACIMSSMPPPPAPEKEKEKEERIDNSDAQSLKPTKSEKSTKSRSVSPRPTEKNEVSEDKAAGSSTSGKKKKKEKASASVTEPYVSGTDDVKTKDAGLTIRGKPFAPAGAYPGQVQENAAPYPNLDQELKRIEKSISAELNKVIGRELDSLYRRIDEERKDQQAAGEAKQESILQVLSSTLTDNVEKVIGRLIATNIQNQVVPAISDVTAVHVQRAVVESLGRSLAASIPGELRQCVPDAVNRALSHPDMLNRISDALAHPLSQTIEREFSHAMHTSLIPTFQNLAMETTRKSIAELECSHNDTIARLEHMRMQDAKKIDQLMSTIRHLSDTMSTMVKQQSDFQDQVRQAQEDFFAGQSAAAVPQRAAPEPISHHHHRPSQQYPPHQHTPRQYQQPVPPPHKTPEQREAEEIEELLKAGKYEDGTIKWLQSKERQAELFDEVMVRYRYDFLPNLSQLVLLSVSAAVSVKFEHKVADRLSWLEGVLSVLDPMDPEIHEICHRIMVVVVQRLESLYMAIQQNNQQDKMLRTISSIARRAKELSNMSALASVH
ncbi:hypothetical protein EX30DRAFT_343837 [Ascodesmis nigricans]|uniref:EDC4-like protein pdc1 beta-propeller domain-containing protein n=1 Tax=Ascodesmis nigricans TaxID=341454 RepID=A0A4S2MLJ4_9PEZI|nr:hypothetical protein EX30DRAFT_343837 [Ascodesmis nigricans]